jgi:iron complex outermembrane receptor protein
LKVKNRVDNGNPDNDQSNQSLTLYGEYLFRTQLNLQKEKGLVGNLSAGFMGSRTTTSSPLFSGDQKTSNLALYAQFEQKIGRFKFELGSRYEHYTLNAYTENKPIFRSGLNYQLRKATFLRGSYGQGYRFPTIAESYISTSVGPVSVFPNKNLKSETGDNLEFGVIQGLSFGKYFKGLLNISLFQMRYKEMMEFSFGQWSSDISPENGFGIGFKSINTGSTTISGYEFSVNLDYDKRPWKMSWMGGYTFSNPLIDNPNEIWGKDSVGNNLTFISTSSDTAGYYLKYRSRHVWKVDWQTNYGPWTAGVSLRYNNAPDNVDAAFVKPPISFLVPGIQKSRDINYKGDLIVDFRFFYQFKNYRTGVIINNLFNEDRFVRPSDIGPPRLVTIQIQYLL